MAKGVKRTELEIEAQEHLDRLREIVDLLAQDKRRVDALREQLMGADTSAPDIVRA